MDETQKQYALNWDKKMCLSLDGHTKKNSLIKLGIYITYLNWRSIITKQLNIFIDKIEFYQWWNWCKNKCYRKDIDMNNSLNLNNIVRPTMISLDIFIINDHSSSNRFKFYICISLLLIKHINISIL
jgi:hypothetical protein